MEAKVINKSDIPKKRKRGYEGTATLEKIVSDLINSDADAVEVVGWEKYYKSYNSVYVVLSRITPAEVMFFRRDGRIFLEKKTKIN